MTDLVKIEIKDHIAATGNPFGLPAADRFKSIDGEPPFKERAEVLYYVGCDAAYHSPEIANAMIRILGESGADFTLLRDETTTGKPLTVLGYQQEARQAAESLREKIKSTGCTGNTIISRCPVGHNNSLESPLILKNFIIYMIIL